MSDDRLNPYVAPKANSARPANVSAERLFRDTSFWGLTLTQFLGAFNDNVYKQILLLLFVEVPTGVENQTRDLQWLATLMFSIPFIFLSGYAGYLSDRFSKRRVIISCKIAEIGIMAIGALLFYFYARSGLEMWLVAAMTVTLFCMGSHSALFGPSKYGILPEMLRDRDLPNANGFILMTTFLAIIFGSALAGSLLNYFNDRLWVAGGVCIGIAVLGTITAITLRRTDPAIPELRFDWSTILIPRAIRDYLATDHQLLYAVIASSIFWMTAAVVQMAVNALGKLQLHESAQRTSFLVATISIGIAIGSLIAGAVSQQKFNTNVLKAGVWGMVVCLALLAIPAANSHRHLLGYWGSIVCLVLLGGFTGMFAVPLQVFMQVRPPKGLKGRMIATQNVLNWIGITLSAAFYPLVNEAIRRLGWPPSAMFGMTAGVMLLVAVFYRPRVDDLGGAGLAAASTGH